MTGLPSPRIGDKERDAAATLLTEAFARGRLGHDTWSDRCDRALSAVTQADLDALTADLKPARRPFPISVPAALALGAVVILLALAGLMLDHL